MKILTLSSDDLESLLDLEELRESQATALRSQNENRGAYYPRTVVSPIPSLSLGFMPAHIKKANPVMGYKAVSVVPSNDQRDLNPHQGVVVLLNPDSGQIRCLVEGSTLTALRTAALSALATEKLSRINSQTLAVIGSGRQAFEHLRALQNIKTFSQILVWSRSRESALKLKQRAATLLGLKIELSPTPADAVRDADIVVTCTAAKDPILKTGNFKVGSHINAIGACRPGNREIDFGVRTGLNIFVDDSRASEIEAEELRTFRNDPVKAELGAFLSGKISGRKDAREITVFKSVGLGIQDIAAADYFYRKALAKNRGQAVEL
jgi:ornithine cyclodeaminase/alanine dehydrogenase-like protein (mu-crystallin family)